MSSKKDKKIKYLICATIFGLLIFWWSASLLFNESISFKVLRYHHELSGDVNSKILKGDKINSEFYSKRQNLGIVNIKFNRYVKPDFEKEDQIIFRIKEKGMKDWLYEQKYQSGLFQDSPIFPFGFPIITNSSDKDYQIQIESLKGNNSNALSLRNKDYEVDYFNTNQDIKKNVPEYLILKSINSVLDLNFLIYSSVFLIPLFIFLFLISLFRKKNKKNKYLLFVSISLIFIDIFIVPVYTFGILIISILVWLINMRVNKISSNFNFTFAFILFLIWIFLKLLNIDVYTSKLNIWTYVFLSIGAGTLLLESKLKIRKNAKI